MWDQDNNPDNYYDFCADVEFGDNNTDPLSMAQTTEAPPTNPVTTASTTASSSVSIFYLFFGSSNFEVREPI